MARGRSIRDLFVRIGFDADDAPLQRIDRGVTRLKGNLRTLGRVAIGVLGAGGIGGFFVKIAAEFEQSDVAFQTFIGSAEKMKEIMGDLFEFAKVTPFTVQSVVAAGKQLLAFGVEADDLIETLTILGNVAAGTVSPGSSLSEHFRSLARNYGQVRTAQRLLGRDMNDFTNRGVPLYIELAKVMGRPTTEIKKLGEQGQISFDIVEKAFKSMSSEGGRFFNLMDKQSKTTLGLFSNIKDTISLVSLALGNKLLPKIRSLEIRFLKFIELNRKFIIQRGGKIFTEIGEGIMFALKVAKDFGLTLLSLTQIFGGLENTIKFATIALFAMFSVSLLTGIGEIVLGIGKIALGITAIGNAAALAQAKAFALPILMGLAVATLLALLDDLATYFTGGTSLTGIILKTFEKKFPTAIKKTNDALRELRSDFIELPKILAKNAIRATKIMEDLKKALTGVGTEKEIEKSKTFMDNIIRTIKSLSGRAAGYLSKGATEIIGRRFLRPELFTERQIIPLRPEGGALGRFIERPPTVIGQTIHLDLTLHGVDLSESDKIKDVVVDAVKTGMLAPAAPNLQGAVSR